MKHGLSVNIGNLLFKRCFFFYKTLYFPYKKHKDRETITLLKEKIKPAMAVLDIGGNIGFYTVLFSRLVGNGGRVHTFEPDILNFKYLRAVADNLKNVCFANCAVGAEKGKLRLYFSGELNTRHQTYDIGEKRKSVEVASITIDDYFCRNEKVDFIKLDVEGYEFYALSGMKETIKRSNKVMLLSEFWPYGIRKSGADPFLYLDLLKKLGLKVIFTDSGESLEKICQNPYKSSSLTFLAST